MNKDYRYNTFNKNVDFTKGNLVIQKQEFMSYFNKSHKRAKIFITM